MGNKQAKIQKKQTDVIATFIQENHWKDIDLITDLHEDEDISEIILVGHCGDPSSKEMGMFYGSSVRFLRLKSSLGFFRELCIKPSLHLQRAFPDTNKDSKEHLAQCLVLAIMGVCCFTSIASLEERHTLLNELSKINTISMDILKDSVNSSVFADIMSPEVISILEDFLGPYKWWYIKKAVHLHMHIFAASGGCSPGPPFTLFMFCKKLLEPELVPSELREYMNLETQTEFDL